MEASSITLPAVQKPVVFGVYRDGDNNLDKVQERNVTDFIGTTARNDALKVIVEDTTAVGRTPFRPGSLRTESSVIEGGREHVVKVEPAVDMSERSNLAAFVCRTLQAKAADARFAGGDVWLDLVDHGGGDGGGLQSESYGGCMSMEDIAGAIADGRARFAAANPQGDDHVTGVVANQCLMATLAFAEGYYTGASGVPLANSLKRFASSVVRSLYQQRHWCDTRSLAAKSPYRGCRSVRCGTRSWPPFLVAPPNCRAILHGSLGSSAR